MTNSVLCGWIPPYRNKVTLLDSRLVASFTCNPAPPPPSLVSCREKFKHLLNTFFESKEIICNGNPDYFRFFSSF